VSGAAAPSLAALLLAMGLALGGGPATASEMLGEQQSAWIYAHAGQEIPLGDGESLVIYPPLSLAWIFDGETLVEDGRVIAAADGGLAIDWRHSGLRALPKEPPDLDPGRAGSPHPLAAAYDALLGRPLARALAPLPAGARFDAFGAIRASDDSVILGLWQNRGTNLRVTLADGRTHLFSLAELAQATQTE
jgi:hypothetical protein